MARRLTTNQEIAGSIPASVNWIQYYPIIEVVSLLLVVVSPFVCFGLFSMSVGQERSYHLPPFIQGNTKWPSIDGASRSCRRNRCQGDNNFFRHRDGHFNIEMALEGLSIPWQSFTVPVYRYMSHVSRIEAGLPREVMFSIDFHFETTEPTYSHPTSTQAEQILKYTRWRPVSRRISIGIS
jgi:hypothetical protein